MLYVLDWCDVCMYWTGVLYILDWCVELDWCDVCTGLGTGI